MGGQLDIQKRAVVKPRFNVRVADLQWDVLTPARGGSLTQGTEKERIKGWTRENCDLPSKG